MNQHLFHWTLGQSIPLHISLEIIGDTVMVAYFRDVTSEPKEDDVILGSSEYASLKSNAASHPVVQTQESLFIANTINQGWGDKRIALIGFSQINKGSDFMGSREYAAPAIFCFQVDGKIPVAPYNLLVDTIDSKRSSVHSKSPFLRDTAIVAFLHRKDVPLSSASFVVRQPEGSLFASNITGWVETTTSPAAVVQATIPKVLFAQPTLSILPDATASVDFSVKFDDGSVDSGGEHEALFESTGGYLPVRRVATNTGTGSIRISALCMLSGESFKVKAGFNNYSGTDETLVEVL